MSTQSVTTPHGAGTSTDAEVSHTPEGLVFKKTLKTLHLPLKRVAWDAT